MCVLLTRVNTHIFNLLFKLGWTQSFFKSARLSQFSVSEDISAVFPTDESIQVFSLFCFAQISASISVSATFDTCIQINAIDNCRWPHQLRPNVQKIFSKISSFFFDYSINNIQNSIDLLLLAEHCVISMDNSQLTSDLSECVDGPVDVGE